MQEIHDQILNSGGKLITVSPEHSEFSKKLREKLSLTFPVLEDKNSSVAVEYGLTFKLPTDLQELYRSFGIELDRFNTHGLWELPLPATFGIDRDGIIQYREVNVDYTHRPEPGEAMAFIKKGNLKKNLRG